MANSTLNPTPAKITDPLLSPNLPLEKVFDKIKTSAEGLTESQAETRLKEFGPNQIASNKERPIIVQFLMEFINPLTIALVFVAGLSFVMGERIDSIIVVFMALLSTILSFTQEYSANKTAKKLSAMVKVTVPVLRSGKKVELPLKDIVPGDIVELTAGKMVPADVRIIAANSLYVSQAALNGESFPVKKTKQRPKTMSIPFLTTIIWPSWVPVLLVALPKR